MHRKDNKVNMFIHLSAVTLYTQRNFKLKAFIDVKYNKAALGQHVSAKPTG